MTWFRQNQFLGTFLIVLGVCTIGALWFLWSAKSGWDEASRRFNENATELNRLERLTPYPNDANLRAMKAHAGDYDAALAKLKEELKTRVLPETPLKPNEFQSRLRLAIIAISEKARANKVKLPDNFFLGFDEFASALPNSEQAAKLLGQELAQIEWLLNTMLDARIESLTSFKRTALLEEHGATSTPTPSAAAGRKPASAVATGPKLLERNVVEATFVSSPGAARKVLNQIASANQQFYIVRLLQVRNEKEKGPAREVAADASATSATSPAPVAAGAKSPAGAALSFIVGNERIETSAKIEIVRFIF